MEILVDEESVSVREITDRGDGVIGEVLTFKQEVEVLFEDVDFEGKIADGISGKVKDEAAERSMIIREHDSTADRLGDVLQNDGLRGIQKGSEAGPSSELPEHAILCWLQNIEITYYPGGPHEDSCLT
ncbi:hypothetical protein GE061_018139 [Apolygus lucorum]|uniref:Uncharacterized protein n=1 Tax=Apolygus lucorum TaxID=248454 RepID=A0A8S9XD63_APOLU|nr:hypothetical protein GE061_018139 [Apolygus lucorum]